MTKLLTEEELRRKLTNAVAPLTNSSLLIDHLVEFVQEQKLAHGEMVIGKNREYSDRDPKWYQKCCDYINVVKGKQRERNK